MKAGLFEPLAAVSVVPTRFLALVPLRGHQHWAKIFNSDSTLTSAVLDRLLHHADTVVIEGKSFRMKDQIEAP